MPPPSFGILLLKKNLSQRNDTLILSLFTAGIKAAQHDLTPIPASGGAGGDRKRKKTRRPVTMVNTHMAAIEAQLAGGDKSIPRDESNPFRPK
jgi:hypothetical protein